MASSRRWRRVDRRRLLPTQAGSKTTRTTYRDSTRTAILKPSSGIRDAAGAEADISMVAATHAWLLNYSAREDDGVLLGASSLEQLDDCLDACANIVDLPDNSSRRL